MSFWLGTERNITSTLEYWTLKSRLKDTGMDTIMKSANIISLNETHFGENDTLTPKMMGIIQNILIFQHTHNNSGGGVALIINKKIMPEKMH